MICPSCSGKGQSLCHINTGIDSSKHRWERLSCGRCGGSGQINDDWFARGMGLREKRRQLDLSLLEASELLGISIAAISSMELGKSEPIAPSVLEAAKQQGGPQ